MSEKQYTPTDLDAARWGDTRQYQTNTGHGVSYCFGLLITEAERDNLFAELRALRGQVTTAKAAVHEAHQQIMDYRKTATRITKPTANF